MEPLLINDLCLRPYKVSDVQAFVAAVRESHATVGRWMSWYRAGYSRVEAEAWFTQANQGLQDNANYELGIFTSDGATLLGGVGLNQFNRAHNFCNLGYWVRASKQGQGIATRASGALADYGFRELQLARIEIVAAQGNLPSQRVAQKIGAAFECMARNRLVLHGQSIAAAVYSVIPERSIKP
ncbi:MAG: GNAT family N-acetyltransferase [Gammaproteobacteria bacterium]|nr:GNAT family N-acetyltransferase [Gammaproteobacteria bacterium]